MYCQKCGKENLAGIVNCAYCGEPIRYPAQPQGAYYEQEYTKPKTSGMAIASLVLGILGLLACGITSLPGLILGAVGLSQINRSEGRLTGQGLAIGGLATSAVSLFLVPVMAAIVFPVFARAREAARKSSCQSNMKELALALQMYTTDHGALPSSILVNGSSTWNADDSRTFCGSRGATPPVPGPGQTWVTLLYPHMRNKDIIWCPSDPVDHTSATQSTFVSYYYKAAADCAWYGGFKKMGDFGYSSDQVIFWEHNGWHWGDSGKGAMDGVSINVAYLDGHVAAKRIQNSGYTLQENPPGPLPGSGVGEPAWFNKNAATNAAAGTSADWDPTKFLDELL
jgi:prepilin-type processing-associated H-X9-DG protein